MGLLVPSERVPVPLHRQDPIKAAGRSPGGVMPDPHFSTNPAKVRFTPDLKDYPEALVKAYQKREKENPSL